MEDDVLKLKEVVSVTFDTTPFFAQAGRPGLFLCLFEIGCKM